MKRFIVLAMVFTLGFTTTGQAFPLTDDLVESLTEGREAYSEQEPNRPDRVTGFITAIIAEATKRISPQLTFETGVLHLPILWVDGKQYENVTVILSSNGTWTIE